MVTRRPFGGAIVSRLAHALCAWPRTVWLLHAVALAALLVLDGHLMALWRAWDTEPVERFVMVFMVKPGKGHFHAAGLLLLLGCGLIARRPTLSGLALRAIGAN